MFRSLSLLLFAVVLLPLAGCGKKLHPVSGVVNLDGKAVAGATVTFTGDDGSTASGVTDDSGNFTLKGTAGDGLYAGNYKVAVSKYPKVEGTSPSESGEAGMNKDYLKQMKKEMDASKKSGGPMTPPGGKSPGMPPGGKGPVTPPSGMMPPGGSSGSGVKSELPEMYASHEKSGLTVTVPAEGVKLELKSKP